MHIEIHDIEGVRVAELLAEEALINSVEDGLDLLMDVYYQDMDRILIYRKNMSDVFWDLKSGLLGDLLQKFSNYRVRLAIVGGMDGYMGNSMRDFIYESNKLGYINFVDSREEAITRLCSR